VWERIQGIDSVSDLLQEVDTGGTATRYSQEYFHAYGQALAMMLTASLTGSSGSADANQRRLLEIAGDRAGATLNDDSLSPSQGVA
jgi:hypothetical protein